MLTMLSGNKIKGGQQFLVRQGSRGKCAGCVLKLQFGIFAESRAYTSECDPNPLAFPSQNNELTQPNHTQQYPCLCACKEKKGRVLLSWKSLKSLMSAFWVYFYASLRGKKITGEFSCSLFSPCQGSCRNQQ